MPSALLERLSVAIKACSEDELEQLQKLPQPRFSENYFGAWRTSGLSGWLRSGLVSYRFASVLLPCSHGFPMLLTWILYGGHSRQMPLRVGGHQWRTMARRTSADIGRTSADIGRKSLIKRTVGFGMPPYGRSCCWPCCWPWRRPCLRSVFFCRQSGGP